MGGVWYAVGGFVWDGLCVCYVVLVTRLKAVTRLLFLIVKRWVELALTRTLQLRRCWLATSPSLLPIWLGGRTASRFAFGVTEMSVRVSRSFLPLMVTWVLV